MICYHFIHLVPIEIWQWIHDNKPLLFFAFHICPLTVVWNLSSTLVEGGKLLSFAKIERKLTHSLMVPNGPKYKKKENYHLIHEKRINYQRVLANMANKRINCWFMGTWLQTTNENMSINSTYMKEKLLPSKPSKSATLQAWPQLQQVYNVIHNIPVFVSTYPWSYFISWRLMICYGICCVTKALVITYHQWY